MTTNIFVFTKHPPVIEACFTLEASPILQAPSEKIDVTEVLEASLFLQNLLEFRKIFHRSTRNLFYPRVLYHSKLRPICSLTRLVRWSLMFLSPLSPSAPHTPPPVLQLLRVPWSLSPTVPRMPHSRMSAASRIDPTSIMADGGKEPGNLRGLKDWEA